MKKVEFRVYVCIHGEVEIEDTPKDPNDLLNAIFPYGWVGEVSDVLTDTRFLPNGYMNITDETDEEQMVYSRLYDYS